MNYAALRKARGLTQAELAQMLGVEQSQVSRIERQECRPNRSTKRKLERIFAAELGELTADQRRDGRITEPVLAGAAIFSAFDTQAKPLPGTHLTREAFEAALDDIERYDGSFGLGLGPDELKKLRRAEPDPAICISSTDAEPAAGTD